MKIGPVMNCLRMCQSFGILPGVLTAAFLLTCSDLVTAQALPPSEQTLAQEGWVPLDSVVQIINDEVITASELARESTDLRTTQNITISTLEELRKFESEVRTRVVIRRLQSQAGRFLGLPEEQVDSLVENHVSSLRRRTGLQSYLDTLDQRGMAENEFQLDTKRQFYGQTWMDDIVGDNKAGKRPYRDRFVRPGEMLQIYTDVREQFGAPEQVELEQFICAPAPDSDPISAMAEANSLRQQAEDGADFADLVREVGPERSVTTSFTVPIRNLSPAPHLQAFAETAELGQFSEVQIDRDEQTDEPRYSFFRLMSRVAPVAPRPFLDGQVQIILADRALAQRDQWYLALGHQTLVEGSFIEPPLEMIDGSQAGRQ